MGEKRDKNRVRREREWDGRRGGGGELGEERTTRTGVSGAAQNIQTIRGGGVSHVSTDEV